MSLPTEPVQVSAVVSGYRTESALRVLAARLFVQRVWRDVSLAIVVALIGTGPLPFVWLAPGGDVIPAGVGLVGALLAAVGVVQLGYWIGEETLRYLRREAAMALEAARQADRKGPV